MHIFSAYMSIQHNEQNVHKVRFCGSIQLLLLKGRSWVNQPTDPMLNITWVPSVETRMRKIPYQLPLTADSLFGWATGWLTPEFLFNVIHQITQHNWILGICLVVWIMISVIPILKLLQTYQLTVSQFSSDPVEWRRSPVKRTAD